MGAEVVEAVEEVLVRRRGGRWDWGGGRGREKGEGRGGTVPVESALFVEELEEEGSGGFAVDFGRGGDGDSVGGRHCAGGDVKAGGIWYLEKIYNGGVVEWWSGERRGGGGGTLLMEEDAPGSNLI